MGGPLFRPPRSRGGRAIIPRRCPPARTPAPLGNPLNLAPAAREFLLQTRPASENGKWWGRVQAGGPQSSTTFEMLGGGSRLGSTCCARAVSGVGAGGSLATAEHCGAPPLAARHSHSVPQSALLEGCSAEEQRRVWGFAVSTPQEGSAAHPSTLGATLASCKPHRVPGLVCAQGGMHRVLPGQDKRRIGGPA